MTVQRLMDANANRAREAMRVMEDAARFLLDDATLTGAIKSLRHDFADVMRTLGRLSDHRDTPGDVGTAITTDAERSRTDEAAVAVAAGKRLSEALRSCEEFAKTIKPATAARIEAIRYRGYTLESRLNARLARPDPRGWRVAVLISESLCLHHDWLTVAKHTLDGGARCLQLREKSLEAGPLLDRAMRLRELVGAYDQAAMIVNDRPDIAVLADAHGVHLGQSDLPIGATRQLVGQRMIIGASTHNLTEARAASRAGADYCGVGAMFTTTTKQRKPSGLTYLRRFVRDFPNQPHLAIGGITPDNIGQVVEAGAQGVAVSACVCGAKQPTKVVRQLVRAFG